jgi:uncharacterized protein (DUF427 family)
MKAVWQGQVIAESDDTVVVEGNHYFPRESVNKECMEDSSTTTNCHWKGTAHYFSVVVKGERNTDAAWYYPEPKPQAEQLRDKVAFWRGVEIIS